MFWRCKKGRPTISSSITMASFVGSDIAHRQGAKKLDFLFLFLFCLLLTLLNDRVCERHIAMKEYGNDLGIVG